ncbi:MAG: YebC/PmpR family DNA-binding transcriptional regulator [Hahellaceae bacterium]|nr:YebC/PmpR family DNA-binding transcriptional regulator [Hahellaceae bacterium]
MGAQWKAKHKSAAADARTVFSPNWPGNYRRSTWRPRSDMNPRLRLAVDQAKKASMPKDTLERAIKKGAGLLNESVTYELVTYEGFAPHQVPVIVECLTDNKIEPPLRSVFCFARAAGRLRLCCRDFSYLGIIEAQPTESSIDPEEAAIEAGAQDLETNEDGTVVFYTEPTDLDAVSKALPGQGFQIQSAALGYRPKNPVSLSDPEVLAEVEAFLEARIAKMMCKPFTPGWRADSGAEHFTPARKSTCDGGDLRLPFILVED